MVLSLETGELVLKDLAFQWPPGDKFYKGKIISHGCKGSWGRGLYRLVKAGVGGNRSLYQVLMSVTVSCLVSRGSR